MTTTMYESLEPRLALLSFVLERQQRKHNEQVNRMAWVALVMLGVGMCLGFCVGLGWS